VLDQQLGLAFMEKYSRTVPQLLYFELHDKSGQAMIAALHENYEDHRRSYIHKIDKMSK
jgi:hypothetical protein